MNYDALLGILEEADSETGTSSRGRDTPTEMATTAPPCISPIRASPWRGDGTRTAWVTVPRSGGGMFWIRPSTISRSISFGMARWSIGLNTRVPMVAEVSSPGLTETGRSTVTSYRLCGCSTDLGAVR